MWYLIAGLGVVLFLLLIFFLMGYTKAPPDRAIIISGVKKEPKILIGKAGFCIPFFERKDYLSLRQITIDIKTDDYIPTSDFINIKVDAVAKVWIDTSPEMIKLAMRNFLGKRDQDIVFDLQDSLQGNMREIIGTMSLEQICKSREAFGNQVQEKANCDMNRLGIEIISCNIQNIEDRNGLIQDMGMDNTQQIKKTAAIAKANAERDIAIAESLAQKEANDARVKAQTEIAERDTELSNRKAELKQVADEKQAIADAAYQIQAEKQRSTIETQTVNADIAKQERLILLKEQEAVTMVKQLDAEVRNKADAQKYAEAQKAEAELIKRQKLAEADRYEVEQVSLAQKAKADAEMYESKQRAEGIRLVGEAEAEAIKAKALAEAEGIDKKAEAMRKMGEASVLEMFFNAYPQIMEAAAKPLEKVNRITMYGEGNSAKMVGDIVGTTTKVIDGIREATGVDLNSVLSGFVGGTMAKKTKEPLPPPINEDKKNPAK